MPSFTTSSTLQRTIHQGHRRLERLGTDDPRAIFHLGQITTIQKTMRYLLSFLLALACLTSSAQQLIFGSVRDGILKTPLADARVSLLTTDSIVVQDSIKVTLRKRNGERWRHSEGKMRDFTTLDAFDYQYGLMARYTLPDIKTTLSADANIYSRRGYGSKTLNTDDFVMNASVSQPFLKGKLIATWRSGAFALLGEGAISL